MKYLIPVMGLTNIAMAVLMWMSAGSHAKSMATMEKSRDEWRDMTIEAIEAAKECQRIAGWRK